MRRIAREGGNKEEVHRTPSCFRPPGDIVGVELERVSSMD